MNLFWFLLPEIISYFFHISAFSAGSEIRLLLCSSAFFTIDIWTCHRRKISSILPHVVSSALTYSQCSPQGQSPWHPSSGLRFRIRLDGFSFIWSHSVTVNSDWFGVIIFLHRFLLSLTDCHPVIILQDTLINLGICFPLDDVEASRPKALQNLFHVVLSAACSFKTNHNYHSNLTLHSSCALICIRDVHQLQWFL